MYILYYFLLFTGLAMPTVNFSNNTVKHSSAYNRYDFNILDIFQGIHYKILQLHILKLIAKLLYQWNADLTPPSRSFSCLVPWIVCCGRPLPLRHSGSAPTPGILETCHRTSQVNEVCKIKGNFYHHRYRYIRKATHYNVTVWSNCAYLLSDSRSRQN